MNIHGRDIRTLVIIRVIEYNVIMYNNFNNNNNIFTCAQHDRICTIRIFPVVHVFHLIQFCKRYRRVSRLMGVYGLRYSYVKT